MSTDREALWTLRLASPADASAISEVLTAGIAAWGAFLGAQRIEAATRGKEHPADLVAVAAECVFAFVAWDAASGEILRRFYELHGWREEGPARVRDWQARESANLATSGSCELETDPAACSLRRHSPFGRRPAAGLIGAARRPPGSWELVGRGRRR